jgi:DNA replication protein DnaC
MGLTRDQFDTITNIYNDKRLNNKIKLDKRKEQVYADVPDIEVYDRQIASLAVNAARRAVEGDTSFKDSLADDIANISRKKRSALLANGYSADYLDEIFDCPICKDTGFIGTKQCSCLDELLIHLIYSRSDLQDILSRENFDTFNFDYYSDNYIDENTGRTALDNIESVVDDCQYFIKNFDNKKDNLLFYGKAGTGKTFLINCIAKELIEKSYSVIYLSAVQLFDLLASYSFNKTNESLYRRITLTDLHNCDLLIIDDLGTELTNSFTDSSLFDCLNERLIHQKSTIISTNFSIGELQQKYEERIFSRVIGKYTTFKIFGDDIRIKQRFTN